MPNLLDIKRQFLLCVVVFLCATGMAFADKKAPDSQINIATARLANGMEILVIPDHRSQVVTHMVWFRTGSIDDPEGKSGIAHFFEHLMFRGTEKVGEGEFWSRVNAMGGELNAFTSYDYTGYYERVTRDKLETMMQLEADRMQNLIIDDQIVAIERDVILEERSVRVDSRPASLLSEKMMSRLHAGSPYKTPIIGWRDEIAQLNPSDALAFYQRYYAPDNAILVVAGNITLEELMPLAEKYYGPLKAANKPRKLAPYAASLVVENHQTPEIFADRRVRQQSWQRFYRLPAYHNTDDKQKFAALAVASEILGNGTTGRLHKKLVVDTQKAAMAGSYDNSWQLHEGMFFISASLMPQTEFDDIGPLVDAEIEKMASQLAEPAELQRAKVQIIAESLYARDSQTYLANAFGAAAIIGIPPQAVLDWPKRIEQVSAAQVRQAVRDMLVPSHSLTGWLMLDAATPAEDKRADNKQAEERKDKNAP
jgi:zinc protease